MKVNKVHVLAENFLLTGIDVIDWLYFTVQITRQTTELQKLGKMLLQSLFTLIVLH